MNIERFTKIAAFLIILLFTNLVQRTNSSNFFVGNSNNNMNSLNDKINIPALNLDNDSRLSAEDSVSLFQSIYGYFSNFQGKDNQLSEVEKVKILNNLANSASEKELNNIDSNAQVSHDDLSISNFTQCHTPVTISKTIEYFKAKKEKTSFILIFSSFDHSPLNNFLQLINDNSNNKLFAYLLCSKRFQLLNENQNTFSASIVYIKNGRIIGDEQEYLIEDLSEVSIDRYISSLGLKFYKDNTKLKGKY